MLKISKYITVNGKLYELRVSDYLNGVRGWFRVKVYREKKRLFSRPIDSFNTFDDPIELSIKRISMIMDKEEVYFKILERLKEDIESIKVKLAK